MTGESKTRVCSKCGGSDFYSSTKNNWCRKCSVDSVKEYHRRGRLAMEGYKEEHGCAVCGETKHWRLEFHHVRDKKKNVRGREWFQKNTKAEVEKCIVLCANCHSDVHYSKEV